jgi:hypothetical protein
MIGWRPFPSLALMSVMLLGLPGAPVTTSAAEATSSSRAAMDGAGEEGSGVAQDGTAGPLPSPATGTETPGSIEIEDTKVGGAQGDELEYRVLSDDVYLTLGGFLVNFKTQAGASFGGLLGTRIDLENDLGVDSRTNTFRLDGFWRYKPKHALSFSYFSLNRSGASAITDQIEFEEVIFEVGAEVESRFDTDWFGLGYRYSMLQTERGEAGIGVGVSTYSFDLGLAGLATVDDGQGGTREEQVDVEEGIVAPVPVVGLFLGYGITPRLYFRGSTAVFKADISDWSVRLLDTHLTLDYFFSRHVGVGFGFNGTDIDVARYGDDPFSVTYRQSGLLVYLSLGF